jgi:hypothetical protein
MPARKLALAVPLGTLAILTSSALPLAAAAPHPSAGLGRVASSRGPDNSRELWATINMCNPKNAPGMVGVRGSMPDDGNAADTMYMRFLLQYYDASSGKWVVIDAKADSGFVHVGSAATGRQAGRSFTLAPSSSRFTLRAVVDFQWRRGKHAGQRGKRAVYKAERTTSAGHRSRAGADPPGYSAATCVMG